MKGIPGKDTFFYFCTSGQIYMIDKLKRFISENNLIRPGDKILLAVSGGIDSMVMAHLFHTLHFNIGIAHCNFSLRGHESDDDEELVRKYASDNHMPFHTTRFDTKSIAKKNRLSIQMAARELRYNWFEDIRIKFGYDSVAVAHNLNDNIETLLINLVRGTGLAGMSGMKPVSDRIIRPLLFATRQDIINFRNSNNIIFREDKSNADTKYIRNKIRHRILPVLKEINPSVEITLNETAERFSGLNEIVTWCISRIMESVSEETGQLTKFNIHRLKTYLNNRTLLYELFKPFGITNALITDLIRVIEGRTGGMVITDTHRIIRNRNELIVSETTARNETIYSIENKEAFLTFPGISSVRRVRITDAFEIPSDSHTACLDAQKLAFPAIIRKWETGDYFYPLGMKKRKKLSDYFIDKKYSKFDKENAFILESAGKIVWIVGERIDDRFKITSETKNALIIHSW
jgi:tRNA(Ile)-lysidine synthase